MDYKYQVDIVIEASPYDDDPDGAKIESHCFDNYDKAFRFAVNNINRDVFKEVHIHYYTDDEYGKEYYPEKMESVTDLIL